jgi:hypothetical protein
MLNRVNVIDNLLPPQIVSEIDYYIWEKYQFVNGHSSKGYVDDDHSFLSADTFKIGDSYHHIDEDPIMDYLLDVAKVSFSFQVKDVERKYVNFHPVYHSGSWHVDTPNEDSNIYTLLYMNSTQLKNKGNFQVKIEGEVHEIEYVPGRFILFNSSLPHRGMGCDQFRTTVAFKSIVT